MESISKQNINDLSCKFGSEIEQSIMRFAVIIVTAIFVIYSIQTNRTFESDIPKVIIVMAAYPVLAFLLYIFTKLSPKICVFRILVGVVLDVSTLSIFMTIEIHWVEVMSWFYLIIIIGNGFRFGVQYMLFALISSLIGFTITCTVANYWDSNLNIVVTVYLSTLILSFYMALLLKRLTKAIEIAEASTKAKGEFLANMSHEIRTPMNAILGMLELVINDAKTISKPQLKRLIIAKNSADSLLVLLNDILDLSKIEAGKISFESIDFNLKDLISESVSLLKQNAHDKNISLKMSYHSDVGDFFKGDPTRIRQTIINLLGNAIKFTKEGRVEVEVEVEQQDQSIILSCDVTDTGIGISEEAQNNIFQYFTQADASTTRNFGGTGLGLALSQRLVHEMGGTMGVVSQVGKGSTFSFNLFLEPANKPKDKIDTIQNLPKRKQQNNQQMNVLVAEDNTVNQIVIQQMLKQLNCDITIKGNGQLLVDTIIENPHHNFDLILMDCHMPVLDGYKATQKLHAFWKTHSNARIPIIALTANVMLEDKQKCLDSGMDDYMAKPIKLNVLADMMEKWTNESAIST